MNDGINIVSTGDFQSNWNLLKAKILADTSDKELESITDNKEDIVFYLFKSDSTHIDKKEVFFKFNNSKKIIIYF